MREIVLGTVTALLLTGCSTHYKKPVVLPEGATFPGILTLDSEGKSRDSEVDLVSVHGMCTHDLAQWVVETGEELARAIDGVASEPEKIGDFNGLQLYRTTVRSESLDVTVNNFSFLWSPMTTPHKLALCYDSSEQVGECPEPTYGFRRASLNGELKSGLINDCLSDALIYASDVGQIIRESFRTAIRAVGERRTERYSGPLFIITESLGSKVMTDSLDGAEIEEKMGISQEARALLPTRQVYMAANQIPLLTLAIPKPGVHAGDPETVKSGRSLEYLNVFLQQQRERARGVLPFSGSTATPGGSGDIGLVAFTDPNDLLSYGLQTGSGPSPVNVTISNAKTYFGYVANPFTAHTEYLNNPKVWDLIIHGR